MADTIHSNHRSRMRQRAVMEGFSSFADHELLEYLLYHSIPRVDTNPMAHALLDEFGSIKNILEASDDELCRVKGIGENSALLFDLIIEFLRRYEASFYRKKQRFEAIGDVVQYLRPKFQGLNVEYSYLMLLDNSMSLIDCVLLAKGDVNCNAPSIRKITELVLNKKVSAVILSHNHPNGLAVPSSEDGTLTDTLYSHLGMLGVVLVEHIIFAEMNFLPIMKNRCGIFRCSPITGQFETDFYERFYGNPHKTYRMEPYFYKPTPQELLE